MATHSTVMPGSQPEAISEELTTITLELYAPAAINPTGLLHLAVLHQREPAAFLLLSERMK
jgi:hypothetical protein